MEQAKIDRINELSRISKERELTKEEAAERQALRHEYIASWRCSLEQTLEKTYLDDGLGNLTKLKRKD